MKVTFAQKYAWVNSITLVEHESQIESLCFQKTIEGTYKTHKPLLHSLSLSLSLCVPQTDNRHKVVPASPERHIIFPNRSDGG